MFFTDLLHFQNSEVSYKSYCKFSRMQAPKASVLHLCPVEEELVAWDELQSQVRLRSRSAGRSELSCIRSKRCTGWTQLLVPARQLPPSQEAAGEAKFGWVFRCLTNLCLLQRTAGLEVSRRCSTYQVSLFSKYNEQLPI